MALRDELAALAGQGSDRVEANPAEAWRPRLELGAHGGFLVSTPRAAVDQPDAAALLAEFDLDASAWSVTNLRRSRWQAHDGSWLESYRVSLTPAAPASTSDDDFEQLLASLTKWRPAKTSQPTSGDLTYIAATADAQVGKDAGDGTAGTIRRVTAASEQAIARLHELRRAKRSIGTVCLPQMGDCIEGSASQNGKVMGRSDLGVTAQVRLARRLLLAQVKAFAPLAERLIVPAVPGNHDEPHRILITDPVDSWQVDVVAAVQDACAENPALAHVEFRYPERDDPTVAVNFDGVLVGFAHGHQSRDAVKWWHGQALGRTPVGMADVLVSAHYHHFRAQQVGERLWLQCPTLDGGSAWFRTKSGQESPAGMLTLVVGDGHEPLRDLAIVGTERR